MKIINKAEIPIQQCYLCKTIVKIKHKDIKKEPISLTYAAWKCPLCTQFNMVKWEKINDKENS